MGKIINEEVIKQIPILYEELHNKAEVARRLEISPATVNKYLALAGISPPPRKKVVIDEELEKKINLRYSELRNMAQVAKEFGISPAAVKAHLNEQNLELAGRNYEDRDALWFYIIRLFGIESEEQPVSSHNIALMTRFLKKGISYRAQYLTLKWYYDITKHPVKDEYHTIGIIEWIIDDAKLYYSKQEKRSKEIVAAIERQLEQDRIEIPYDPKNYIGKKKKKNMIDLNSVVGDINDTH